MQRLSSLRLNFSNHRFRLSSLIAQAYQPQACKPWMCLICVFIEKLTLYTNNACSDILNSFFNIKFLVICPFYIKNMSIYYYAHFLELCRKKICPHKDIMPIFGIYYYTLKKVGIMEYPGSPSGLTLASAVASSRRTNLPMRWSPK